MGILRTSRTTSSYSETSGIEAENLVPEVSPNLDASGDVMPEDSGECQIIFHRKFS